MSASPLTAAHRPRRRWCHRQRDRRAWRWPACGHCCWAGARRAQAIRAQGLRCRSATPSNASTWSCLGACPPMPRPATVLLCAGAQDLRAQVEIGRCLDRPGYHDGRRQRPALVAVPRLLAPDGRPGRAVDPGGWLWQRFAPAQLLGCVVHLGASLPRAGLRASGRRQPPVDRRARRQHPPACAGAQPTTLTRGGLPTAVNAVIRDEVWSRSSATAPTARCRWSPAPRWTSCWAIRPCCRWCAPRCAR